MTTQLRSFDLTEDELALLPTDDEVQFYAEHGWYLSKKLFTDEEIDTLVAASEAFYGGHRDRTLPAHPPRLAYWTPEKGAVQRHNDYVHYEDDTIGAILRKPLLGAVAARLAEAEEIRVFQSTLIYKQPKPDDVTNIVPWHFDKHYWSTSTSERMLTAFIPFHDCPEEMGTITMVDGSHLWKEIGDNDTTNRHFAERDRSELDQMLEDNAAFNNVEVKKVPMEIPKGHVSFHHCKTYHGSGANVSDRPRRAISLHLQDGANAYRDFRTSDGTQVNYNHDFIVRKTAAGTPDYADPEYCPVTWKA
ncbi:phytanoyl-CoA dioxygenase family protein [Actinokineospora diospyrosa]|uniref:Ectoine hydroxylase-related dioxygenase, phytanoyl-CoA dioxygenase (PhyH) family n=1 Tax=Actinokineospora diospyrosa TaxID=103728 RepID=A0ABT1IM38_9PSEU|nr:phytanoyl-CoA dioxygenase family protein [Actinokineospora diospyrosa]MCP2273730.1 Ectoine hydroxylase-related dioxygenase, phytanoyl-CoA dioxygenase (PhyH) family [Actinokineospora diospyrosa]